MTVVALQSRTAPEIEYKLTDLVLLRDAPKRWPVFTFTELIRAAKAKELPHILKGRRRYVSEAHLKHWMKQKEQQATWDAGSLKSAGNGSTPGQTAPATIDSGMTEEQENFVAEALRQAISNKPN